MNISELTVNNTSASDSFGGWPNGVAPASNVSNEPLPPSQQHFAHRCDWFGGRNHPDIGIDCADSIYCAKTAADMQRRGLTGCFLDWYSLGHNTDKSLLVLKPELEKLGLKFALCVDGGIPALRALEGAKGTDAQRTTALLTALAYARKTYFSSPSYLRHGGKPVLLFFGFSTADFNWSTIRTAMSDCVLIFRWELNYSNRVYADGYFGWTSCNEAWIADIKKRAPGKLIVLGINGYFNNTIEGDPVLCKWGVGKEKVIDSMGGVLIQSELNLAAAHPEILYTSINTWNDYQEGSALEVGLLSGKTLTASVVNNRIIYNDLGPAFSRYELYIATDATTVHSLPSFDLNGIMVSNLGAYTFYVRGIGKPFVQNVLSAPLSATLGWK